MDLDRHVPAGGGGGFQTRAAGVGVGAGVGCVLGGVGGVGPDEAPPQWPSTVRGPRREEKRDWAETREDLRVWESRDGSEHLRGTNVAKQRYRAWDVGWRSLRGGAIAPPTGDPTMMIRASVRP